jgi:ATP-dependent Zn protease
MILYAGIEAERMVFGEDNISTGSSSDISKATSILSSFFKRNGMDDLNLSISSEKEQDMFSYYILDTSYDPKIKELSKDIRQKTINCLIKHKADLLKLAQVLSKQSKITSDEIVKILNLKNKFGRKFSFKEKLNEKIKELENEQTIILPEHNQVENEVSYVLNKI